MARYRDYVFTVNNYTEEDEHQCWALPWEAKDCRYIVVGKEVGDSGTPHLQGYISFKQPKSLKQLKEFFPTAHFDNRRGTPTEASNYCKKGQQSKEEFLLHRTAGPNYGLNADFWEWGALPLDNAQKGAAGAAAMEQLMADTMEAVRQGDYKGVPLAGTHFIKAAEYRVNKELLQDRNIDVLDGDLEHEWHYGVPDAGKSWQKTKFKEEGIEFYEKDPKERWWNDYVGEDIVFIDDFDVYQKAMAGDMKRWMDRYPFQAPVKGGYMKIRPRKIIVTSNYHPDEIWEDEMTRKAILRRVKVFYYPHKWNHPNAGPKTCPRTLAPIFNMDLS